MLKLQKVTQDTHSHSVKNISITQPFIQTALIRLKLSMIKAVAALANQWLCIYMFMALTQAAGAASCLL